MRFIKIEQDRYSESFIQTFIRIRRTLDEQVNSNAKRMYRTISRYGEV